MLVQERRRITPAANPPTSWGNMIKNPLFRDLQSIAESGCGDHAKICTLPRSAAPFASTKSSFISNGYRSQIRHGGQEIRLDVGLLFHPIPRCQRIKGLDAHSRLINNPYDERYLNSLPHF